MQNNPIFRKETMIMKKRVLALFCAMLFIFVDKVIGLYSKVVIEVIPHDGEGG